MLLTPSDDSPMVRVELVEDRVVLDPNHLQNVKMIVYASYLISLTSLHVRLKNLFNEEFDNEQSSTINMIVCV